MKREWPDKKRTSHARGGLSFGAQFIHAIIRAKATNAIRDVRLEYLTEDEAPLYEFVRRHVSTHGRCPSLETVEKAGFELPRIKEPASYYLEQTIDRYTHGQVNDLMPRFNKAMGGSKTGRPDMNKLREVLREMNVCAATTLSVRQYAPIGHIMDLVEEDFDYARMHPGLRGITSGFPSLDEWTLGAQGGDLIITAGRPSIGKSYVLLKKARAAWKAGYAVLFISMEMMLLQMGRRWVALETGTNPQLIQKGELSKWADKKMRRSIEDIKNSGTPVHFVSGTSIKSIDDIAALMDELLPDIVFIDAAYFLKPANRLKGYAEKWREISDVVGESKALAREKNRPIEESFQLNRNVRSDAEVIMRRAKDLKKGKEPKQIDLGDLAGSDSIGQDADVIDAISYGPAPFQRLQRIHSILKAREGLTGQFAMDFRFEPMRFGEVPLLLPTQQDDGNVISTHHMV